MSSYNLACIIYFCSSAAHTEFLDGLKSKLICHTAGSINQLKVMKKNGIHAFALEPSLFFHWIVENNNLIIYVFVILVADRECRLFQLLWLLIIYWESISVKALLKEWLFIALLNVICCQKCGQMCGADSSLTDRQIEISSDWSLEFVLPIAVKDSLGFKRRLTLIFLAWLCDGWGTCLWFLKLAQIFSFYWKHG